MGRKMDVECVECGQQKKHHGKCGVRLKKACFECDAVTTWERVNANEA